MKALPTAALVVLGVAGFDAFRGRGMRRWGTIEKVVVAGAIGVVLVEAFGKKKDETAGPDDPPPGLTFDEVAPRVGAGIVLRQLLR